jgi:hypothetical protein
MLAFKSSAVKRTGAICTIMAHTKIAAVASTFTERRNWLMGWTAVTSRQHQTRKVALYICGDLYQLAVRAYEGTAQAASDRAPSQHDALSAIILSVASLEAFIGELGAHADALAPHLSGEPLDRAKALGDVLQMIEDEKGQLALKFQIAKFVLTGTPYELGGEPYQAFDALLYVRNSLIHPKPFVTKSIGPGQLADPDRKFRLRMRSFEILAETSHRVPVPLSRLIQTRAAARWACNTATEMAHSLFNPEPSESVAMSLSGVFKKLFKRI